ncbi:MAG: fsr 2 [Firmicutes bacterium]|nr:fsr 2 [Bacillota bacterium]
MQIQKKYASSVTLLTAGHFFNDFYNNFLPPLLPLLTTNLNISLTSAGLLILLYSFTSSILQPFCGYFIDKKGYSWLILLTLPAGALFMCFVGFAPNFFTLAILVALSGLGSSVFHPLGSTLTNKVTPTHNKGVLMSLFIAGGNVGFAVAPVCVVLFLIKFGITSLPWLIAPSIILALIYYFHGLHRINIVNVSQITEAVPWYKSSSLIKLNAVMALRAWIQTALPNFLPLLLATEGHPPTLAGTMITVFLISGACGGFIGGWLNDKLGRKTCIVTLLTVCVPALIYFISNREITPLSWAMLIISGIALQGVMPSSIVWAQDIIPHSAAMVSGMMLGLSFGLGGASVAITGAAADIIGLRSALLWTVAPLALAVIIAVTIPLKEKSIADAPS